jgi:hypothetical protein
MIFQSLSLPCDTVYIHINELYSKMASERERERERGIESVGAKRGGGCTHAKGSGTSVWRSIK